MDERGKRQTTMTRNEKGLKMNGCKLVWSDSVGPYVEYTKDFEQEALDLIEEKGLIASWSDSIKSDAGAWRTPITGITEEGLVTLRVRSEEDGDDLLASLCNEALRGNANARRACLVAVVG